MEKINLKQTCPSQIDSKIERLKKKTNIVHKKRAPLRCQIQCKIQNTQV